MRLTFTTKHITHATKHLTQNPFTLSKVEGRTFKHISSPPLCLLLFHLAFRGKGLNAPNNSSATYT